MVTPEEAIKDPFVLEFLGLKDEYSETELEEGHVESFLKVCYGRWGQKGCFSVNSMREFADLPPKARQLMVASAMKAHQLLIDNLAAARGVRDDNDSLAGLIITFFSGICLEQNFGPGRAGITNKIDAFMRLIRGM
jgi:hypothetical protein